MCGIAGFITPRNIAIDETIQKMVQSQAHRGPDASGILVERINDVTIALGHRRLSIIDVAEHANQPMHFEYLSIVYNGEVYNYVDIREELLAENYQFQTNGDTEVVLKAFHKWGIAAIDKFRGMFAFCLLDKKSQRAYLVRDRVGVKPLYYYYNKLDFLFSSEVRSFQFFPGFDKKICENSLDLYLQYGYVPSPWSIFSNTRKVRPGHYVEYDIASNQITEKSYWSLSAYYQMPKLQFSEAELIDQLESILIDSFSLRMVSDVPVGVLLSGGIDSSLVAAILQANQNNKIDTFTMAFDKQSFDESVYAKKISNYLGTQYHEKLCTWKDAESVIPHIPKIYDEPFADSSAIPTALISEFVKKKVKVVLSGDGGDEMFCGYNSYKISQNLFNKIDKIPFRKQIHKALNLLPSPMMSMYRTNYDLYSRYLKLKTVLGASSIEKKYHGVIQIFTNYDINHLLVNNTRNIPSYHEHDIGVLERIMLTDFNQYLPDDLLVKVDRASMYYSLEGREPLLDHRILEFAAQIPMKYKYDKLILKKILAKYIPRDLFDRKKHGFSVPVNHWLRNELSYLLDKYLSEEKIKRQGIFNHHYVTKLCNAFKRSNTNNPRVWTLLTFQMWHEENFGEHF